ncbi:Oxidoreductase htatip2, partial [Geranomyces michiganensis]
MSAATSPSTSPPSGSPPPSGAALVMGATGAVGKALVRELLADTPTPAYSKVTLIVRRELDYAGPNRDRLVQKIVDFENLDKDKAVFAGH